MLSLGCVHKEPLYSYLEKGQDQSLSKEQRLTSLRASLKLAREKAHQELLLESLISLGELDQEQKWFYYDQAIDIAKELDDKKHLVELLRKKAVHNRRNGKMDEAVAVHEESIRIARDLNDSELSILSKCLFSQALTFYHIEDFNGAIELFFETTTLDSILGDTIHLGKALHGLAISYSNVSEYHKSLLYYQQALDIKVLQGDKEGQAALMKNMGISHAELGSYDVAVSLLQDALSIFNTLGDSPESQHTMNSIGLVHTELRNWKEARDIFHESLLLSEELDNQLMKASALNNLGLLKLEVSEWDSAFSFFTSSLKIREQLGNQRNLAISYFNLANTSLKSGDVIKARKFLEFAESFGETMELGRLGIAIRLLDAEILIYEKNFVLARRKLDQIPIETGAIIQEKDLLLDFYELKKSVNYALMDYDQYQHLDTLFHQLKDSIFEYQRLTVIKLQNQFYLEQKENEKQILSQQNDLLTLTNQNQALRLNQQLIFLFAALVIIMLVGWFLINSRKKNKIISSQVEEIAQQNVTIQGFLKDNHHRITNHLQMISTMLGLQAQSEGDTTSLTLLDAKQRIDSANTIHRKLKKEDGYSTVPILAYLETIVTENETISLLQEQALKKDIHSDVEQLPVDIATSLGIITNELVTNSFKHAFREVKEAFIGLSLNRDKDYLFFDYRDNGPGNIEWKDSKQSFGQELIKIIAQNLGGEPEVSAVDGFRFRLKFQLN